MFVALRDIRFARGRFALMGAVVTLITTLVVFLYGLTGGLASAASSAIAGLPADGVVFGAPAGAPAEASFAASTVSPAQRDAVAAAGAGAVHPLGVAMSRLTADGGAAAVSVLGTDPALLPPLVAGTAPADGEVAVGADTAAAHHLAPGSEVTVGARQLTVSAVTAQRSLSHAPSVWTTPETWQQVSGRQQPTALAVRGTPHGLPADLLAVPLGDALSGIDGYAAEQDSLRLIQGFLFAVSALVVGAFFTVWTVQRRPDIAVLKAVGASSGYLVRDALAQAAAVLLAGALLGGALGATGGAFASPAVPFDAGVWTVAVPVGAMVLLGLLGAALAVRRITAVDPLAALGAHR
ncbi:putative ABC transport system permease protein [Kitasatospora sp. SolWspMP-SS2h]|uniref:FtsX-like permease family protein n=1 Tax=Kitasatospora sp. SolWspMP-SS2h TaxID=1305729 RepID=UPI000DB9B775|nr:ABC transporter permease [Kitasatospora sp. SolWspMP-SS2h]RAJ46320.1 putative ABC transport system permease protein [Kitasatospora sp. SolWspMP-SS2h]